MKILILDREWSQTAYLVVSLVRAGFDVVLASGRSAEPWGLGRYCRMVTAPNGIDDPVFIEQLLRTEQADIVFPAAETLLQIVWHLPESLTDRVFPATTPSQRLLLSHRPAMYEYVSSLKVPVPEFVSLPDERELEAATERLTFPLVLRGTQGLGGDQVRVVDDLPAARAAYSYLKDHSPGAPFAQRFLVGQRCLFGGLFNGGTRLQWFSQRTQESSTPTGPSLRVKSLNDPLLTGHATRIFEGLQWTGLACAEFILTETGEYHFLEINPRPWAAIQAAHCCGVPLMDLFAQLLLGRNPQEAFPFVENREVALFPAFLEARLATGTGLKLKDMASHLRLLRAVPWRHPGLLLHFGRKLRWSAQLGSDSRRQFVRPSVSR